jgi:hypothetical protein
MIVPQKDTALSLGGRHANGRARRGRPAQASLALATDEDPAELAEKTGADHDQRVGDDR